MARAALALLSVGAAVAAVDLAHKSWSEATFLHARSPGYVLVVLVLVALWTAAILATRSVSIALAAGVLTGGAVGNLASLALWPGVPNPIVVEPIAFNLADVFVVSGFALTAVATVALALRNRERLQEPLSFR
jgi:lipoprotein signal peptidase